MSETTDREAAAMRLCRRCGLCCDGTLFAWVPLSATEATQLSKLGLAVVPREGGSMALRQPCSALQGKDCRVYAHRPAPCRSFRCHQLIALGEGEASEAEATAQVDAAHRLIGTLAGAMSLPPGTAGVVAEARRRKLAGELTTSASDALATVEAFLRTHFTGRAGR